MENDVLNSPVLVLNKNWTAVRVQTLKKAITKVTNGRAKFLDTESYLLYTWSEWVDVFVTPHDEIVDYPVIRSQHIALKRPEIIVCTDYSRVPHSSLKLSRRNILIRDMFQCQYTGKRVTYKTATLDHILPRSKGGKTSWNNLVTCSLEANAKKANRTPAEAGMRLLHPPKKPKWSPIYAISLKRRPKSWAKFIKQENLEAIEDYEAEILND